MRKNGMYKCFCIGIGGCLSLFSPAFSQVLDDTTEYPYGHRTVRMFHTDMVREYRENLLPLDTLLQGLSRPDLPYRAYADYTNLGTIGTALEPTSYAMSPSIGARLGGEAYTPYILPAKTLTHYNTRSPYFKMEAFLGATRRSWVDLALSRNVHERFNITIAHRRLGANIPIGMALIDNEAIRSENYAAQMNYFSPDSAYVMLAAVSFLRHIANETGGAQISAQTPSTQRFNYEQSVQALSATQNKNRYFNAYILSRFRLRTPKWHAFVEADWEREERTFQESIQDDDTLFYTHFHFSKEQFSQQRTLYSLKSAQGIIYQPPDKRSKHIFFLQQRGYAYQLQQQENIREQGIELSLAYTLWHRFSSAQHLKLHLMARIRGFYYAHLLWHTPLVNIALKAKRSPPFLLFSRYNGNHFQWNSDAFAPQTTQLTLKKPISFSAPKNPHFFRLTPMLSFVWAHKNRYFDPLRLPQRARDAALFTAGLHQQLSFLRKHVFWEGRWNYQQPFAKYQHIWALPTHQITLSLAYEDVWLKNLRLRFSIWGKWREAYFARAFEPVLQQFYLQNQFLLRAYFTLNASIAFQIRSFRGYMRILHLNKPQANSYFASPYYLADNRWIGLGFIWHIYE